MHSVRSIFVVLTLCLSLCLVSGQDGFEEDYTLITYVINGTCDSTCVDSVRTGIADTIVDDCELMDGSSRIGSLTFLSCHCSPYTTTHNFTVPLDGDMETYITTNTEEATFSGVLPDIKYFPSSYELQRGKVPWGVDAVDGILEKEYGERTCSSSRQGSGIHAAVLDTGCQPRNEGFCGGWTSDNSCADIQYHGTHVAGTVASQKYGVAPRTKLSCYNVFHKTKLGFSANNEDIFKGLEWAIEEKKADVINLSLGGSLSQFNESQLIIHKETWKGIVQSAAKQGIYLVIAAGNDKIDACKESPAYLGGEAHSNVFVVQAHDQFRNTASFTNFGSCTDLSAPGVNVLSEIPQYPGYKWLGGTSMAAPHVTGMIARILSDDPSSIISTEKLTRNGFPVTTWDAKAIMALSVPCP